MRRHGLRTISVVRGQVVFVAGFLIHPLFDYARVSRFCLHLCSKRQQDLSDASLSTRLNHRSLIDVICVLDVGDKQWRRPSSVLGVPDKSAGAHLLIVLLGGSLNSFLIGYGA